MAAAQTTTKKQQRRVVSVEDAWLTDNRLDVGDIWPEE